MIHFCISIGMLPPLITEVTLSQSCQLIRLFKLTNYSVCAHMHTCICLAFVFGLILQNVEHLGDAQYLQLTALEVEVILVFLQYCTCDREEFRKDLNCCNSIKV